jgi:hypothetical protein
LEAADKNGRTPLKTKDVGSVVALEAQMHLWS